MNRTRLFLILLTVILGSSLLTPMAKADVQSETSSLMSAALSAPSLGSAGSFAVLGGSTVVNTGSSVITGDLGVNPGTVISGFPPGLVNGATHQTDAVALQAQNDLTNAYTTLAGLPCSNDLTGKDLGGMTLVPGVYCFSTSAQLTGTLTLNSPTVDSVYVFQIGSSLTTASSSKVLFTSGLCNANVFWQVGSSATLGTTTSFVGNIVALTSITLVTGASVTGRTLARNGAVTLDSNKISNDFSSCGGSTSTPNFLVTASPNNINCIAGQTVTSTITVTPQNGFTGTTKLSALVLPSGITVSISPQNVQGSGTATLTINCSTPGTFTVEVRGTTNYQTHSITIPVTVASTTLPSFIVTGEVSTLQCAQGGTTTNAITVTAKNGFTGTVTLSTEVTPSGITATISPASLSTSGSATLTVNCTTAGTYTVTVKVASGDISSTFTVTTTVTSPSTSDFTITAAPTTVTFTSGSTGTSTLTLTSLGGTSLGFAGPVTITSSTSPATGLTVSCAPNPVTLTAGGTATGTCTLSSSTPGTYTVTITATGGTNGAIVHTATITVTVTGSADFTISANPTSVTALAGAASTSTITVTSTGTFNQAVALTASVSPATGLTCTLTPTSVTPPIGGTATSTLSCSGSAGTYTVTITGASTGFTTKTVTVTFTVTATPDFTITADPASLTNTLGVTGMSTIKVTGAGSFAGPVTLSLSSPTGLTCQAMISSLTISTANGDASTSLKCSSATSGTFTATVTGTAAGKTHKVDVTFTVPATSLAATNPSSSVPWLLYLIIGLVIVAIVGSGLYLLRRSRQ